LATLLQEGPASRLDFTLLAVLVTWILGGALLALLVRGRIHSGNVFTVVGFFAIALLYVNVLRERPQIGDMHDYLQAASNLRAGEPFHLRYLYPPFWAAILASLLTLGPRMVVDLVWLMNLASLFGMFLLLHAVLERYGFPARFAALATFGFMLVNVPILRTLGYQQVNLHVTNLILACLFLYPRRPWWSGAVLALAVQLKLSPLLLVLPFVLEKDWRWLAGFAVGTVALTAMTVGLYGASPYSDVLVNLRQAYSASGIAFRENSIDSWFRALAMIGGGEGAWMQTAIWAVKGGLAAAAAVIGWRCVRGRTFAAHEGRGTIVLNTFPPLLILMLMASPLVWEHHPVFAALSYLVVLKGLSSVGEWVLFGWAYALEFLVPTFDFFPWSYGRLLSPLLWLLLMFWMTRRRWPSGLFTQMSAWLQPKRLATVPTRR
jgi:alpha-1,2-mannosyltransferase